MELEYQDRQNLNYSRTTVRIYYEFLEENPNISIKDKETIISKK